MPVGWGPTAPSRPVQQPQQQPVYIPPPPAAAPPAQQPQFNAEMDPRLLRHADRLERRMDDPEGSTKRAITRSTSEIRDASEGRRKALRGMLSRSGALGDSSGEAMGTRQILAQEGRDVADSAAGISLARERDNDSFMLGATGALAAPGQGARADRQFGLDAWQTAEAGRRADDAVRSSEWMRNIDLMFRLGV